MNTMKKRVISVVLTVALLLTVGTVTAFAALNESHPHGGTWKYGKESGNCVSRYYLEKSTAEKVNGVHRSTAQSKTTHQTAWTNPKIWSNASVPNNIFYIEKAYYQAQDLNGNPIY